MDDSRAQVRFTIILLPSGDRGAEALETVRLWAQMGLLQRSIWVCPEDVAVDAHGTATVSGLLLDQDQASVVDLFAVLARSGLKLVQLMLLQILDEQLPSDPTQLRAAEMLTATLKAAVPTPLRSEDRDDSRIALLLLNLITTPTGFEGVDPDKSVFAQFDVNMLAAPEDRRTADQMDQFVRDGSDHVHWAMSQAIAGCGLWSGMAEYPWEAIPALGGRHAAASAQGALVVPMRSFARVVTSAPMVRKALAQAMESVRNDPNNVVEDAALVHISDSGALMDQILLGFDTVDNGRIQYSTPPDASEPGRTKRASGSALGEFAAFSRAQIVGVPGHIADRFRARLSRTSTDLLSGEGGHESVIFDGAELTEAELEAVFERQAVENQLALATIASLSSSASPELWRNLRGVVFALLDGSPMPDSFPPPFSQEQQVVVSTLNQVVAPPNSWASELSNIAAHAQEHGLDECGAAPSSPSDYRTAMTLFSGHLATLQARDDLVNAQITELEAKIEQCDADLATLSATEESDRDKAAVAAATGQRKAHRASIAKRSEELAKTRLVRGVVETNLASLSAWATQRDRSMIWRLASIILDRAELAGRDRTAAYQEAVSVPQIDFAEPRRAHNQFARRFMLWLPFALVASWFVAQSTIATIAGESTDWRLPGIATGVVIVWLILVLLAAHRRRSRFLQSIRKLKHAQLDAVNRCKKATEAEAKLRGIGEQTEQWGQLLGQVAFNPWDTGNRWTSDRPDESVTSTFPACVDLAVPNPDDSDSARRLHVAAKRSIADRGWRARAFERLAKLSLAESDPLPGMMDLTQLDLDSPATPNNTRSRMIESMAGDTLTTAAATDVMASSLENLFADRRLLVSHSVVPVNGELAAEERHILSEAVGLADATPRWQDYLAEIDRGDTEFCLATWSSIGEMDRATRSTITTMVWVPDRLLDPSSSDTSSEDEGSKHHQRAARRAVQNRGVELASRLDVGAPLDLNHLRAFSKAEFDSVTSRHPSELERRTAHAVNDFN